MIELIFTVCLLSSPTDCKEQKMQFVEENLTPMQCMMIAQPKLAEWAQGNPKWTITRWSCRFPSNDRDL